MYGLSHLPAFCSPFASSGYHFLVCIVIFLRHIFSFNVSRRCLSVFLFYMVSSVAIAFPYGIGHLWSLEYRDRVFDLMILDEIHQDSDSPPGQRPCAISHNRPLIDYSGYHSVNVDQESRKNDVHFKNR